MIKNGRLVFLTGIVIFVAAIIFCRLFYLQVINGRFYASQALGQQAGFKEITGERGQVFLGLSKQSKGHVSIQDEKSLAINRDVWTVSAVPKMIKDRVAFAQALVAPLALEKDVIEAKLKESDTYVILAKNLDKQRAQSLASMKLEGLALEKKSVRYYPQEDFASQLAGFVGSAGEGQYGLEGYYNDILKGKEGISQERRGLDVIGDMQEGRDLNGSDLHLTLDYNLQFEAETLLAKAKKSINIDSGQIIVIKPDTGRILVMANYPNFNPNEYGKQTDYEIFQNASVQKVFEPGSVFKPFTMAMGLNEGKITPQTTFVDTGSLTIGPDTLYNFGHEVYGQSDMSRVLEKSINTGAAFIEQKITRATFFDYVKRFGFTQKTGIDLQGEVATQNKLLGSASPFVYATASFGQGIEMTPIQLVKAFCMFANGGHLVAPYVVEKVSHGTDEQVAKPQTLSQVISAQTASQVTTMLTNVVERGFGDIAKIPGYYLAGKTGTAQVPYKDKKGYYPDKTIQSFIGFGPAKNPQFLILVKMDNPNVPKSALSAAPIFKQMAQYIINYWQIPPDYTPQ